jgi:geranylgeranylglycerol-phosphate geranylgeranyltransferase
MKMPTILAALFPVIDFTKQTTRHHSVLITHRIPPPPTCNVILSKHDRLFRKNSPVFVRCDNDSSIHDTNAKKWHDQHFNDLFQLMRPFTLLQAVGALLVGCLAILSSSPVVVVVVRTTTTTTIDDSIRGVVDITRIIVACISVYVSYGTGMVINDCVDHATDAMHEKKRHRPLASGRVSVRDAWIFSAGLAMTSIILAKLCSTSFSVWTLSNLLIMSLYGFGLQKLLLIKNMIVGWLGVSPLLGAQLLLFRQPNHSNSFFMMRNTFLNPALVPLAVVGFGVGVAREILKDLEDVDVDRVAGKQTLPHVIGTVPAHRLAFAMTLACCAACWTSQFRVDIFQSNPIYTGALCIGTAMVARASSLPLSKGQMLLKRTIYVLLAGMIGSFWSSNS